MVDKLRICLATQNRHKVDELVALLSRYAPMLASQLELVSLAELGITEEAVEDGTTLDDNARIKAEFAFARTGLWSLADDSGLLVDALDGAPGVHSAYFGGEPRSDSRNIETLLDALRHVPSERRTARFACVLCLYGRANSDATVPPKIVVRSGACKGRHLLNVRGAGGFGYDPLFIPDEEQWASSAVTVDLSAVQEKTFGELPLDLINLLSHRTQALRAMVPVLTELAAGRIARV